MTSKRKILDGLTKSGLLGIAQHYEITGLSGKSKGDIIDAIAGSRRVQAEDFLGLLSQNDLKSLCKGLGFDESGRNKQLLIDRLLGRPEEETSPQVKTRNTMAKRKAKRDVNGLNIEDYRHTGAKRKNNPPAKIAAEGVVPAMPKVEYAYSPRRPPVLRFDPTGKADQLPELLEKATKGPLSKDEAHILADALRTQQPWLEWAGKRETEVKGFAVDPLALHIHERISTQAILKVAARQDVERMLFGDPEQEYHEAVQFYKHEIGWTNRLILGDSLQVMASLARREDLSGKVQMIYMDPPYGIRFGSNFQPEVTRHEVTDKASDLTREPEMVRAYRDTWHLGLHSYLTYLRDRLTVVRELLADTGSLFVQISDDNLHAVRWVLDEVFGTHNFVVTIPFKKKGSQKSSTIDPINDYLLWTTKDKAMASKKFRRIFKPLPLDRDFADSFRFVELPSGEEVSLADLGHRHKPNYFDYRADPQLVLIDFPHSRYFTSENATSGGVRKNQSVVYSFRNQSFDPGIAKGNCWKHTAVQGDLPCGMDRLAKSERLYVGKKQLRLKRYSDDFGATPVTNWWDEFGGASDPVYVVQTNANVIQRCILMTTDPGDLVLDPTCGGGTTAYVAEMWGRRWVTVDTSRVAIAIARQRLLSMPFEHYKLRDENRGPAGGIVCRTVSHVTSSTVANCTALDAIEEKHQPSMDKMLDSCNEQLASITHEVRYTLERKLHEKVRTEGKKTVTEADHRRWELPKNGEMFEHWTVPFDTDPDWPKELQQAVTEYRKAWRVKMDAVNACIAANAAPEELFDQPEIVRGVVRVSGPFTVEAVQPPEMSLGAMEGMFDGEPDELDATFDVKNVESYFDKMCGLLKLDGVRFPNNKEMAFSRLERLAGQDGGLHAEGRWMFKGETDSDPDGKANVAVAFGPQYGPVTAKQVEDLIRSASRRGYDALVVAGFSFDGPAQATIEESQHPKLHIHMAHISPDVNPGMADLLKEKPGSQLFTVFGQPRTKLEGPDKRGDYKVKMEGVDIYDPVTNTIHSTEDSKVAAWFLDGDYDGRTFCMTQAFFPDKSAWDKLANALGNALDADAFDKLSGTLSLPFPAGKHKCVAVKVIDPRGNEVMQIHKLV